MANEMRDRLYDLLGECEKKYSAYYEEFIKRLDKAETQADFEKIYDGIIKKHDFFADHLIENGVIVPPCKVGDTVYCIEHKTIHECVVTLVKSLTYENKTMFFMEVECEIVNPFYSDGRKMKHRIMAMWEDEYGSWYRAFPTKEQAEQKLKEISYEQTDKSSG